MILLVDLEVIRERFDALTQERNLNFGRTRIGVVKAMFGDDGGLRAGCLRHDKRLFLGSFGRRVYAGGPTGQPVRAPRWLPLPRGTGCEAIPESIGGRKTQ